MLFRPSFCANCGEKIERADWHIWTSRRFCDVCVTELPVQEYAPKIVVGFAILASVAGFGTYLKDGSKSAETPLARQRVVENSNLRTQKAEPAPAPEVVSPATDSSPIQPQPRTLAAMPPKKPEPSVKAVADEAYFCGAQTKKGTPCSRRVKGNIRCYQHPGMPAMVANDKLKVG